jgi:RNA polymerase sigma-70 factor (ECF subfamily)
VVREAQRAAGRQLADYLRRPELPLFLWLRRLTGQQLELAHQRHLGAEAIGAGHEVSLYRGALPGPSPAALAAHLLGAAAPLSQAEARAELKLRVQQALNGMDALDREVLTLRHFEQLSNAEAALVLGLAESAACNRYVRALERLRGILSESLCRR